MKRTRMLEGLLALNAALLGGLLWTSLAERAPLATPAIAQETSGTGANAAAQRLEMIRALHAIRKNQDALHALIAGGKLKVEVTNLDDIPVAGE